MESVGGTRNKGLKVTGFDKVKEKSLISQPKNIFNNVSINDLKFNGQVECYQTEAQRGLDTELAVKNRTEIDYKGLFCQRQGASVI